MTAYPHYYFVESVRTRTPSI